MSVYDVILHYNCATSGTICVKSQLSCDNTALFVLIALLVGEITANRANRAKRYFYSVKYCFIA